MSDVINLTSTNFDEVLDDSSKPLLVDLWATWCAPCRHLAPRLEELSRQYAGRLRIAKVDVDAEPMLAQKFAVRSIPTLVFVHNEEIIETIVGALPLAQLAEAAERVLAAVSATMANPR